MVRKKSPAGLRISAGGKDTRKGGAVNNYSSPYLYEEAPLTVRPTLAKRLGLNRAVFLQQLNYWLTKSPHWHEGKPWIYNTYEEWTEQMPWWTPEAIRKIVKQLEDRDIIESTDRFNKRRGDRTKWYTINQKKLDEFMGEDHPDKSTEAPDKSTDLEPDKSTERYQRLPETNGRDSDLQSAEPPVRAMSMGQFYNKELAERLKAKRAEGKTIHSPTDREKKDFGQQFKAMHDDEYELATLEAAIDYQVAKAAGEIEGEPNAWCGFRTAFDRVVEAAGVRGSITDWKNTTSSRAKDEPINPHGVQGTALKDKPYNPLWYVAAYGVELDLIENTIEKYKTHTEIIGNIAEAYADYTGER